VVISLRSSKYVADVNPRPHDAVEVSNGGVSEHPYLFRQIEQSCTPWASDQTSWGNGAQPRGSDVVHALRGLFLHRIEAHRANVEARAASSKPAASVVLRLT